MNLVPIRVIADNTSRGGQIAIDKESGKLVNILDHFDTKSYYTRFANLLGNKKQSAVIGSFDEQKKLWSTPPNSTTYT